MSYVGVIIKQAETEQPRDVVATARYMADLAHEGHKVPYDELGKISGSMNCVSPDRGGQLKEIDPTLKLHGSLKSTQAASHQILSYPAGFQPTRQQIERDIRILLKKYGMNDHALVWDAHINTDNFHIHILLSRVSLEPNEQGEYPIADKGLVKTKTTKEKTDSGKIRVRGPRTDWAACRQAAVAELNDLYGWGVQRNVRYTPDGTPIFRQAPKDPHSDKTRQGERKSGKKSHERQISEIARKIFASSKSWHECDQILASFAIQMTFKTQLGKIVGGYLTGPDSRKCAFSKCGPDCSYPALEARFGIPSANDAACINEYHLQPFEYQDHLTVEEAKKRLLPVFANAPNWPRLIDEMQSQGMCLERSGGGLVVKFNDGRDDIKCSEISNEYSLSRLEKQFGPCPLPKAALPTNPTREQLIKDADAIFSKHIAQGHGLFWMESDLEQANISIIKKKFQSNAGWQHYYAIERDGVSVQISHIAKGERGRSAYSMQLFERLDRNDPVIQRMKAIAEQKKKFEEINLRCSTGGDLYEEHMSAHTPPEKRSLFIDIYGNIVYAYRKTYKAVNHGVDEAMRRLDAMRSPTQLPGPFSGPNGAMPRVTLKS